MLLELSISKDEFVKTAERIQKDDPEIYENLRSFLIESSRMLSEKAALGIEKFSKNDLCDHLMLAELLSKLFSMKQNPVSISDLYDSISSLRDIVQGLVHVHDFMRIEEKLHE